MKTPFQPIILVIGGILTISAFMAGCPAYKVWTSKMNGEAELAHANYSKSVQVAEATGKQKSASLLAQADTIRANGIARSNEIIGRSLQGNDAYLRWLWIDQLKDNNHSIVYVATEAGIPITEAGRHPKFSEPADSTK